MTRGDERREERREERGERREERGARSEERGERREERGERREEREGGGERGGRGRASVLSVNAFRVCKCSASVANVRV